jgi:hypothetical protein
MALDAKRRQKKLARKVAKRKTALVQKKQGAGMPASLARAPLYRCYAMEPGSDVGMGMGMGDVIVSRRLSDGSIAAGVFLLDLDCLGVKDAFLRQLTPQAFDELVASLGTSHSLIPVEAACARKLVEGAVAFAAELGFEPHKDYDAARRVLGDVDPAECTREFSYGRDGKPLYVPGPSDSPARIREVMATLERRVGAGNYDYLKGEPVS